MEKKDIIGLIDLTSLNDDDNDEIIRNLCSLAIKHQTASVCIYKQFIPTAQEYFKENNSTMPIATVINFPKGENNLKNTMKELDFCNKCNVEEVDVVLPYKEVIDGNLKAAETFLKEIRNNYKGILKVIIESGELKKEKLIRDASKLSLNLGVDFIKTSTGKVPVNATLQAATFMMEEIKNSGTNAGFKAAGGIKTYADSLDYLSIGQYIMGEKFTSKKTFRFGASSLLQSLLGKETDSSNY